MEVAALIAFGALVLSWVALPIRNGHDKSGGEREKAA